MLPLVLALTISCSVIVTTLSAPLQVGPVDEDFEDRFDDALKLLAAKKALSMGFKRSAWEVSQQGSNSWHYPPQMESEDEVEESQLSPSEKAAHRHFEVSEPGTGPILNHPLGKGTRKKAVERLIQLLSEVD